MLPTASAIIENSWHLYHTNRRILLPYFLGFFVPPLAQYAVGLLAVAISQTFPASELITNIVVLLVVVANLIIILWNSLALTVSCRALLQGEAPPAFVAAWGRVSGAVWPTIYTSLLLALVIFGGTLLLIIPGIIFLVWYYFTIYAVVFEGARGVRALFASQQLVVGRWWATIWRLAAPLALFLAVSFTLQTVVAWGIMQIPFSLIGQKILINVVAACFGALVAPLTALAGISLYLGAKTTPVNSGPTSLT